jgi:hypothetical protein
MFRSIRLRKVRYRLSRGFYPGRVFRAPATIGCCRFRRSQAKSRVSSFVVQMHERPPWQTRLEQPEVARRQKETNAPHVTQALVRQECRTVLDMTAGRCTSTPHHGSTAAGELGPVDTGPFVRCPFLSWKSEIGERFSILGKKTCCHE